MIDQLLKLIEQNTQETVVKNTKVPDKHNEGVQKEILNSIEGGISSNISKGKMDGIMDLFSKGANKQSLTKSPVVKNISQNLIGSLSKKFGLSKKVSKGIANNVLPAVMNQFSQKVADPKDKSIDMNSVISSVTGGKGASGTNFNDILGQFMNGKSGGIDLKNIAGSLFSGSKGKATSKGGLIKMLSGLFKK